MTDITGTESGMARDIAENQFRTDSKLNSERLLKINPRAQIPLHEISKSLANKEITFSDSLEVARQMDLIPFPDPSEDTTGGPLGNTLNFFMFNYGNAIMMPQSAQNEQTYIFQSVTQMDIRLPQVIEGVRTVAEKLKTKKFSEAEGGERTKKIRSDRISKELYSLEELQIDLITDEVSNLTKTGWEKTRKDIVDWSPRFQKRLEKYADKSQKLRSLVYKPTYENNKGSMVSPVIIELHK